MTTKVHDARPLDDEVRLARLHLRVGLLVLARSELEDLERRSLLDVAGRAALAEARWRTGDAEDAAAAARSHLDAGGEDPVAICIAAEAAAADGRPAEARALIDRLGTVDAAHIDALFAGMPRRAFWPSAGAETVSSETLFGDTGRPHAGNRPPLRAVPGPKEVYAAVEPGLWGGPSSADAATGPEPGGAGMVADARAPARRSVDLDPVAELAQAREELGAEPERALVRLALVLRIDPSLAPAVLDAINLRREPAAAILRGDAQRLLGRHLEAEAAFARAADWLEQPSTRTPT
jgi:hypothetical protein